MGSVVARFLALLLITTGCAQPAPPPVEPYPVPHNAVLSELHAHPEVWNGKFIALRGTIDQLEPGPEGKPLIELSAIDPSGRSYSLWIGSLVKPARGWLELGHTIRVTGFFSYIERYEDAPPEAERLLGGYHLLAVCIVNETTTSASSLAAGRQQCERWFAGEQPERLARPN